ncbi:MAG: adenine deaminase [Synergistaceae bacterium]|jgi:adenine deaminase|nr:adenine deaminase [Synergistaceae bacterium]
MPFDEGLIRTALGREPADVVIKNGKLVNVNSGEIYAADIAIRGSRVASIGPLPEGVVGAETKVIDATGFYLAPGFIDAHIHIESSMLTYTEFAKMVAPRGTTAVASDLMEVTIVSGLDGMRELLAEARHTPVRLYYPIPSFMDDSPDIQTTGSELSPDAVRELLELPEAIGLAEVLAPPVLAESPKLAETLEYARRRGKTLEGHAPALRGEALNAYAGVGIRSDHETTSHEEALEKLRVGLRLLLREGSASADLLEGIKIVTCEGVSTRNISLVSDDIDALHIARFGHMDHKVRMAIKAGVPPVEAIQMATINPAESLKIDGDCGSISPGKFADIVFLSSLEDCTVKRVISRGETVVEDSKLVRAINKPKYSDKLLHTVRLKKPVTADDMAIKGPDGSKKARVRVIAASGYSLLTGAEEAEVLVQNGIISSDASNDVLHIACVERYGKDGGIGRSFISGVGLKEGAIAISVGHDHHNVTVVGCEPYDMAKAVNRVAELDGGVVFVRGGEVRSEIPLPVCGLLSNENGEEVAEKLRCMILALEEAGCELPSPNVTLSFITLIFIPELAITDKGLFDVRLFKIVDPIISLS